MDFYYINSNGRKIDLTKPPYIGEISNDLINYKWTYSTQGQAVQRIVQFDKSMVSKKFHVLISGDDEDDYYGNLEKFLQLTDVDINNIKKGRLYIDEYFLEGYIISSIKPKKYLNTNKTLIECTLICERGNWQKEKHFVIRRNGDIEGNEGYTGYGIRYPYDYPYDYSAPFGNDYIVNEAYLDTDFELTFYGASNDVQVEIGGNVYGFTDIALSSDEYIKVNSKNKTCLLYRTNGAIENVFKYRFKDSYIYEKIKGGGNRVDITENTPDIDLTLFYERSEPKWSKEIWT